MEEMTLDALLRNVTKGRETVFDVLEEAGPDGSQTRRVAIGSRQLQPEPPLEPDVARAMARAHVFNDVDSFGDYLKRAGSTEATLVLADVGARTVTAILNDHDESDRESVTFCPLIHPLFAPWYELIGSTREVKSFAMFAMQHRRRIMKPDGMELAMMFSQIKAAKTITKRTGIGPRSINGVVVEMDIAGERSNAPIELPDSITISAPLLIGTEPETIEIDILVTEQRDDLVVYATAPDVEQSLIESFGELVEQLREQTGYLVGMGSIAQREWRTVR